MKRVTTTIEPTVLTEEETAALLQITPFALRKWRRNGYGPCFIRLGRLIRYGTIDVHAWLDENTFSSSAHELKVKSQQ